MFTWLSYFAVCVFPAPCLITRCIAFMEAPSLLSRHFRPQINELAGYLAACVGGAQVREHRGRGGGHRIG